MVQQEGLSWLPAGSRAIPRTGLGVFASGGDLRPGAATGGWLVAEPPRPPSTRGKKCGLHRVSIPHAARMRRNHREAFVVTIRIFYAWNVDVAEDISCHYRSQKGDVWPAC
jgi:hypothetical protein